MLATYILATVVAVQEIKILFLLTTDDFSTGI
jgi:hypothetical protein